MRSGVGFPEKKGRTMHHHGETSPKYGFTVTQDEYFPDINLPLRLTRTMASTRKQHPVHFHAFTEIGIAISGTARHLTENGTHELHPGDVILIPCGACHGFSEMEDFRLINLLFIQSRLPLPLLDFGCSRLAEEIFSRPDKDPTAKKIMTLNEEQMREISALTDRILEEEKLHRRSFYFLFMALFIEILVILDRAYESGTENHRLSTIPSVLEYLEKNYRRKIDFDALARRSGMSRRTFFRCFRRAAGTSPMVYLHSIRIRKAVELLRTTDLPLSVIAMECGYGDGMILTRHFKKAYAQSPVRFRKSR